MPRKFNTKFNTKKRFPGGRIFAVILGVFLLFGAVSAGRLATPKHQLFQPNIRAYAGQQCPYEFTGDQAACVLSTSTAVCESVCCNYRGNYCWAAGQPCANCADYKSYCSYLGRSWCDAPGYIYSKTCCAPGYGCDPNGVDAGCFLPATPTPKVNGVCGSAITSCFSSAPSTNLCSSGNASSVSISGTQYKWTCNGSGGGSSPSCAAEINTLSLSPDVTLNIGQTITNAFTATSKVKCTPNHVTFTPGAGGHFTVNPTKDTSSPFQTSITGVKPTGTDPTDPGPSSIITATSYSSTDNSKPLASDTANVTVRTPTITLSTTTTSVQVDKSITATAKVSNLASAGVGRVTFTSNNSHVATGTTSEAHPLYTTTLTGNTQGQSTITAIAYSANGTKLATSNTITVIVTAAPPVNGACGSANGQNFYTAPTSGFCSTGSASSVLGTGPWSWNCTGLYNGTTVSCSANKSVNGVCGTNACTCGAGNSSNSTTSCPYNSSTGIYSWTCYGLNGGSDATSCSQAVPVAGACDNTVLNGCNVGSSIPYSCTATNNWTWYCAGLNGGANSTTCSLAKPALTISLPTPINVDVGFSNTITTTVPTPADLNCQTISRVDFTSANPALATATSPDDFSPYTSTITGVAPGTTTVTARLYVNGDLTTVAATSDATVTVTVRSWWQVINGDIQSNGNLQSAVPENAYFNIPPTGWLLGYPGVVAYTLGYNFTPGTVSAKGWLANSSPANPKVFNYSYFANQIPSDVTPTVITDATTLTASRAAPYGYIWLIYNGTTPLNIPAVDFAARKVILLVPNADVNIAGNITLTNGSGFFMLITKGNITVGNGVGGGTTPNLEGIYETDGKFDTGTSATPLYIRGSVIANGTGGVNMTGRTFNTAFTPAAVTFEYAPDQIMLFPGKLGTRRMNWNEVAP